MLYKYHLVCGIWSRNPVIKRRMSKKSRDARHWKTAAEAFRFSRTNSSDYLRAILRFWTKKCHVIFVMTKIFFQLVLWRFFWLQNAANTLHVSVIPNSPPAFGMRGNHQAVLSCLVCGSSDLPNHWGATWIPPRAPCRFFGKKWAAGSMATVLGRLRTVNTCQMMSPSTWRESFGGES